MTAVEALLFGRNIHDWQLIMSGVFHASGQEWMTCKEIGNYLHKSHRYVRAVVRFLKLQGKVDPWSGERCTYSTLKFNANGQQPPERKLVKDLKSMMHFRLDEVELEMFKAKAGAGRVSFIMRKLVRKYVEGKITV